MTGSPGNYYTILAEITTNISSFIFFLSLSDFMKKITNVNSISRHYYISISRSVLSKLNILLYFIRYYIYMYLTQFQIFILLLW